MADSEGAATQINSVNFGKRLAHTDKVVRDRGFKTLKAWLRKHPELERLELMKLWKGLYFCMWMADKRPVQQELCVQIALLLGDVPKEKQVMWVECFWETMLEAWEKLDKHRISKYLLFVRIVVAEVFKVLRVSGWDAEEAEEMAMIFACASTADARGGPNVPCASLVIHFTRIFWEELQPQLEAAPASPDMLLQMLEPFCGIVESTGAVSMVKAILNNMLSSAAVPKDILERLAARLADGAGKVETPKKNREALYDAVDALEKLLRPDPQPGSAQGALHSTAGKRKRARRRKSETAVEEATGTAVNGDGAMDDDDEEPAPLVVSPLLLPRAAMAGKKKLQRKAKALPRAAMADKKKLRRKAKASTEAAPAPAPKKKGAPVAKKKIKTASA